MTWCELKGFFEPCQVCKSRRQPPHERTKKSKKATKVLDLVHCNVQGPLLNHGKSETRYFIPLPGDPSGLSMVRLMRSKSKAPNASKEMKAQMEKMTD